MIAAVPASSKRHDMDASDDARLIRRLDAFCERWLTGEGERRSRDRRGMRLFRGEMWEDGIGAGRLAITSNTPLALYERVAADVLRGQPEPEVEAVNPDEEDAARVAEGALRTNWRNTHMRAKMSIAYRLAGFTRPVGMYHYWRHELNGGLGDVDKRMIPGHRLIVDERTAFVRDMEFVGFEEEMSRAKLITLFPDKADEIEEAIGTEGARPTGMPSDPLKPPVAGGGAKAIDRLVTTSSVNAPPYNPVTSIKTAGRRGKGKGDPLSETVRVRFMWIDDPKPKREKRPRLDPKTHRPMYALVRDEDGKPVLEQGAQDVVDTPLGPQYVQSTMPKTEMVMEDVVTREYRYSRHVAYIVEDKVKLWDVAWDGPVPISILRDRWPAYGFDAPGSALRLATLGVARNVLWTIIFERLKKSMGGNWITTVGSGLKRNSLLNEIGNVYTVNGQIADSIKEFPQSPLDAAYFSLLTLIEQEMELLIGVTPMMRGQAAGRADSPQTYEQLADQSGGPTLDRAKLVDQFISDASEIDLWFMQNYYTHEHVVEVEAEDGFAHWTEASALAIRGKFSVRVETGVTLGSSAARDRQDASDGAQAGFYSLPMQGRVGRYRYWRQALKQKGAIMAKGPQFAWLLGAAGASPQQQAMNQRAQRQRSHHRPGGK